MNLHNLSFIHFSMLPLKLTNVHDTDGQKVQSSNFYFHFRFLSTMNSCHSQDYIYHVMNLNYSKFRIFTKMDCNSVVVLVQVLSYSRELKVPAEVQKLTIVKILLYCFAFDLMLYVPAVDYLVMQQKDLKQLVFQMDLLLVYY